CRTRVYRPRRGHFPPRGSPRVQIETALMPNKIVIWSPNAQAQVAAIDRKTALDILHAIDDYLTDGVGEVKKLRPPAPGIAAPGRRLSRILPLPRAAIHRNPRSETSAGSISLKEPCRTVLVRQRQDCGSRKL